MIEDYSELSDVIPAIESQMSYKSSYEENVWMPFEDALRGQCRERSLARVPTLWRPV